MILVAHTILAFALGYATSQDSVPFRDSSPHRTQLVSVGPDVQLEVLDWGGTGRAVVFLAGYLTAHVYDEIAPKLTDIAHVYGITRRGLGHSSKPPSGYTATESAQDVLRVLDALRLEKPVLAGHSFGGQDLHVVGATYPDRTGGLVYLASAEDTSLGSLTDGVEQQLDPNKLPEALRAQSHPDMSSFTAYRDWQRKTSEWPFLNLNFETLCCQPRWVHRAIPGIEAGARRLIRGFASSGLCCHSRSCVGSLSFRRDLMIRSVSTSRRTPRRA
jgi:pimeloyl-ACP methyl ester carboxylesterase